MKLALYLLTANFAAAIVMAAGVAFIHFGPGAPAQRFLFAVMFMILAWPIAVPCFLSALGRRFRQAEAQAPTSKPALAVHSWLGVGAGAILFVVCFTGSVAMLEDELAVWENPALRLDDTQPWITTNEYAQIVTQRAAKHGDIDYVYVSFPRPGKPYFDFAVQIPGKSARALGLFEQRHPQTGEQLSISGSHLSKWLRDLHSDLSLRQFNGRYWVGVFGLFMMVLITSGVLIHAKLLKNLFIWRIDAPGPMGWRDSHNALAVWSLIFAFLLAYSGAAIALIKPLLPLTASVAYPNETPAVYELFETLPLRTGEPAEMMNFDELTALAQGQLEGKQILSLRVFNWNDENARAVFLWRHDKALAYPSKLELNAITGELLSIRTTELGGYAGRIHAVLAPLHFGLFGGGAWGAAAAKFLYALLGLACALTCSTGVSLWLEKRRKQAPDARRADRLLVGICTGSVLATCATMLAYKAASIADVSMQSHIGLIFCLIWAASIAASMAMRSDASAFRFLMNASAASLVLAALGDLLFTSHSNFSSAIIVDAVFVFTAATIIFYTTRIASRNSPAS